MHVCVGLPNLAGLIILVTMAGRQGPERPMQKTHAYVRAGLPTGDDGVGPGIANRSLNR